MRRKPHSLPYKKGKVTTILTNTGWDMRNKTSQQKAIVAQRERTESLLKEEQQKNRTKRLFEVNNSVFSKSLYMKLGRDVTKKLNGYERLQQVVI